jgi:hypothetical protein
MLCPEPEPARDARHLAHTHLEQLGYPEKPIAVLGLGGYFDPLWNQIQRGIDERFIKAEFLALWYPASDVDALLRYLESHRPHGYGRKWW